MQQPTHPTALRCAPAAAPAVPAGQVFMMDKRFLDPRRPIVPPGAKPTPEQVAEGLLPYSSELPMGTTMFVTADKQVGCARGGAAHGRARMHAAPDMCRSALGAPGWVPRRTNGTTRLNC